MIFIKPLEGVVVLDELGRPYPKDGKLAKPSVHIKRLVKEGSLVVIDKKKKEVK